MRVIVERTVDEGTRDCYGALGLIHRSESRCPAGSRTTRDAEVQAAPLRCDHGP